MNQEARHTERQTCEVLCGTRTFKGIAQESLRQLVEQSKLLTLAAGSDLFRPGDAYRQEVYTLIKGNIIMYRPSGREDSVQPGDFIGLANYLDKRGYSSTARATTESILLVTSADALHRLEQEQSDLFNALNRVIAAKLRERSPDRSITSGALARPVYQIMKSPVAGCAPDLKLKDAFSLMCERRIGGMVIEDQEHKLLGVLTYAGLAEATLLNAAAPDDCVMQAVCETSRVIGPNTPLWQADELMRRFGAKYLVVVEGEIPVGILSQTDILRTLISRPNTLRNRIRDSVSMDELIDHSRHLGEVAAYARETNHRPSEAVRLLSETHLMMQRRAVEFSLEWMEKKGHGTPPCDYALFVMGSGGRREMLLNPDQDNGMIIADHDDPSVDAWFERFCRRVNKNLDKLGYALCPGEIMARNPLYRKSISQWKKQITHITKKPTQKAARLGNVLFDFDCLYGNDLLTSELRQHSLSALRKRPRLLKLMSDHDAEGKPAIGFFNQLLTTKTERGEWVDIKRNGLRIIADAARIFALQNGVAVQNTSDRLRALTRVGKLSDDFADSVQEAFEELLDLALNHQLQQARGKKQLDKLIDPEQLTPQSRSALRMAMRAVKRFQERLLDDYGDEIF